MALTWLILPLLFQAVIVPWKKNSTEGEGTIVPPSLMQHPYTQTVRVITPQKIDHPYLHSSWSVNLKTSKIPSLDNLPWFLHGSWKSLTETRSCSSRHIAAACSCQLSWQLLLNIEAGGSEDWMSQQDVSINQYEKNSFLNSWTEKRRSIWKGIFLQDK